MLSKLDRRLYQVGSILLPVLVAIIIIFEPSSTGFRIFATLVMIGFIWQCQFMLRDWEYVKDHEHWSGWAGPVVARNLNQHSTIIDTGVMIQKHPVILNIETTHGITKYLGRWTVFTDPQTGVRLWRDNLKYSGQIFYFMAK